MKLYIAVSKKKKHVVHVFGCKMLEKANNYREWTWAEDKSTEEIFKTFDNTFCTRCMKDEHEKSIKILRV